MDKKVNIFTTLNFKGNCNTFLFTDRNKMLFAGIIEGPMLFENHTVDKEMHSTMVICN